MTRDYPGGVNPVHFGEIGWVLVKHYADQVFLSQPSIEDIRKELELHFETAYIDRLIDWVQQREKTINGFVFDIEKIEESILDGTFTV